MPSITQRIVFIALTIAAIHAWALEVAPVKALECWIAPENDRFLSEYIRCLHREPSEAPQQVAATDPDPEEALLEQLRQLLHRGRLETIDSFFKNHIEGLKLGKIASVRLGVYPSPWSWDEEMPHQLVRALLCPKGYSCPVSIRRN